jgi:hypothetical protein
MMPRTLPALMLLLVACGGAEKTADKAAVKEAAQASADALPAACEDSAKLAREAITAETAAPAPSTPSDASTRYNVLATLHKSWKAEAHPCSAPGPKVTERAQIADELIAALANAADGVVVRGVNAMKGSDLPAALALLTTRYSTGDPAGDTLRAAASDVTRAHEDQLFAAFEANKAWARTGEAAGAVTCIFGQAAFDPKAPPTRSFNALFEGKTDVHALCLIPLPADKWAGDPQGQVVMELRANGEVAAELELGPPEKWANTRYFRGRFGMPQGIKTASTAAYSATLIMRRPKLGTESLSTGVFFWQR